jgi:hypothetical protein
MWARSSVRTEHRTFTQKTTQRNPVVAGSIPVGPAPYRVQAVESLLLGQPRTLLGMGTGSSEPVGLSSEKQLRRYVRGVGLKPLWEVRPADSPARVFAMGQDNS